MTDPNASRFGEMWLRVTQIRSPSQEANASDRTIERVFRGHREIIRMVRPNFRGAEPIGDHDVQNVIFHLFDLHAQAQPIVIPCSEEIGEHDFHGKSLVLGHSHVGLHAAIMHTTKNASVTGFTNRRQVADLCIGSRLGT